MPTNDPASSFARHTPLLRQFFAHPTRIAAALRDASAELAPLRGTWFDLEPALRDALDDFPRLRASGQSVDDYLASRPGPRRPESNVLLRTLDDGHPPSSISKILRRYNELARAVFPDIELSDLLQRATTESFPPVAHQILGDMPIRSRFVATSKAPKPSAESGVIGHTPSRRTLASSNAGDALLKQILGRPLREAAVMQWSPGAHDTLISHALKDVATAEDIDKVQKSSRDFDKRTQGVNDSPKHSMRKRGQPVVDAIRERDNFVRNTIARARAAALKGSRDEALRLLGEALHPVMDSSSPMHQDANGNPKEWLGILRGAWGHSPNDRIGNERKQDITEEIFKSQDVLIRDYFDQVFRGVPAQPGSPILKK